MNRRTLLITSCVLGLVAVLLLARKSERVLLHGLPPRILCETQAQALRSAGPGAVPVLGTGSMAPYIPPATAGQDPLATVVAYVVLVPGATVESVTPGALCVYEPDWARRSVMHQAASFSEGGWIMTGLSNKTYENKERMTGRNFIGLVARTYIWKTAP